MAGAIATAAACILVCFVVAGEPILAELKIPLEAFEIAGCSSSRCR